MRRLIPWLLAALLVVGCKLSGVQMSDRVTDIMIPVGSRSISLYSLMGPQATAVIFMSTECPCCDDYRPRFEALVKRWKPTGVAFIAVDENEVVQVHPDRKPDHGPWATLGWTFVADAAGRIAHHFGATVTPEVYLLDRVGVLRYHGDIDNAERGEVKMSFLEDALTALRDGHSILYPSTQPTGCFIPGVTPTSGG